MPKWLLVAAPLTTVVLSLVAYFARLGSVPAIAGLATAANMLAGAVHVGIGIAQKRASGRDDPATLNLHRPT